MNKQNLDAGAGDVAAESAEENSVRSRRKLLALGLGAGAAGISALAACSGANEKAGEKKQCIVPKESQREHDAYHFAPAVRVGNLLLLAGHAGVNEQGEVPKDLEEQLDLLFKNIKRTLDAAGATFDDILEITSYHVNFPNDAETIFKVKDKYLTKNYPAWTAVGVTALALPGLMMECKAIAMIGSGQ